MAPPLPHISIIIPTADRPEDVRRCLESLAALAYPRWDAIVVDQSAAAATQAVVEEDFLPRLPPLAYRRLRARGKTRACNLGMSAARGDLLFFLDHDCVLPLDALDQAAAAAARHPRAALVFGAVRLPAGHPERSPMGWIPTWEPVGEVEWGVGDGLRSRLTLPRLYGMGACMVVRRAAAGRIGPFDAHLGPGARFPAGEEDGYSYRALMAGYTIAQTPDLYVEHHGFRDYASGAATRHRWTYDYGYGAALMKAARLGNPYAPMWMALHLVHVGSNRSAI